MVALFIYLQIVKVVCRTAVLKAPQPYIILTG